MVDSSGIQRGREVCELINIKAVGGHSGSADKISECLHGNYSSGADLSWSFSSRTAKCKSTGKASTSLTR